MPRRGKKWVDPKNSTKFRLIFRSYDDPRYGDSESTVRILAPVENPNLARKRLPDEHYVQKEKLIELVESYNDAQLETADAERMAAMQQQRGRGGARPAAEEHEEEGEEEEGEYEDDEYDGRYDDEEDDEEEEEAFHGAKPKSRGDVDDDRFADADEDEDDDLPPLEEDDRKKAPVKGGPPVPTKGDKGKAKAKGNKDDVDLKEYELGEYGFEDDYDYSKHFKPMGTTGAVFMEAPSKKSGAPKVGFMLREDEEKMKSKKIATTDIVDFLSDPEDVDPAGDLPEDLLAALEDPEAFETLNDDFVFVAEEDEDDEDEEQPKQGHRVTKSQKGKKNVKIHEDDEFDDGQEDYYDEDEEDEDVEALLQSLKAKPEGNVRRPRNELEQVFDARFEKALAEFDDDEIGELDEMAEHIRGDVDVDQLKPLLKEFLTYRRPKKGIIMNIADDDDNKSHKGRSTTTKSQAKDQAVPSSAQQGQESENEGTADEDAGSSDDKDEAFEYVAVEEPRDQWDCESITSTYTNTENHPTLIDDGPSRRARRQPPIVLSKKTGIPLGVLPAAPAKSKKPAQTEEAVNQGQARPKNETKEERKARKQQIKEARKVNRERKKELKGVFKEEELRQLSMKAKGQGKRVIPLK